MLHSRHSESSVHRLGTNVDGTYPGRPSSQQRGIMDQAIDPELTKPDPLAEPGYAEALNAWARFRFVRAGWFTAQEAIAYID